MASIHGSTEQTTSTRFSLICAACAAARLSCGTHRAA
jgi:hypothetical protein